MLASVSNDMRLKIWTEDPTLPHRSGRRWSCIYAQSSPQKVPYVSLSLKNIESETYLAAITQDGLLTVMEPTVQEVFSDWHVVDQFRVCVPLPERSEETSFKVRFQQDPVDKTQIHHPDHPTGTMALVVSCMEFTKVFRSDTNKRFYLAASIGCPTLVRDVAWARGGERKFDLLATGSVDGFLRIYELHTFQAHDAKDRQSASPEMKIVQQGAPQRAAAPSGIGAGLVGSGREKAAEAGREDSGEGLLMHGVKQVAEIDAGHGEIWEVKFTHLGKL